MSYNGMSMIKLGIHKRNIYKIQNIRKFLIFDFLFKILHKFHRSFLKNNKNDGNILEQSTTL